MVSLLIFLYRTQKFEKFCRRNLFYFFRFSPRISAPWGLTLCGGLRPAALSSFLPICSSKTFHQELYCEASPLFMKVSWHVARPSHKNIRRRFTMKNTIAELWALVWFFFFSVYDAFSEIYSLAASEVKEKCGLELGLGTLLLGLVYSALAYIFVISVWLILI